GIKIKKQRTSIKLKMPPNKRQPDFSKSRSLVVFLKRVIIYRLQKKRPITDAFKLRSIFAASLIYN
ncbi:hypothetical protein, partial [Loigolactobacillus zhaoyuanensis]